MVGLGSKPTAVLILCLLHLPIYGHGAPQVPCMYVFGDSLSDNGNNNNDSTGDMVNYFPYGIDFPQGPTGRFSNGRNRIDFLAEKLGFQPDDIPPFPKAQSRDHFLGVNYASGGAGIREETGKNLGSPISMDRQLQNHQLIISRLRKAREGVDTPMNQLNRCLYVVGIGNNDYINNYFLHDIYPTSKTHSLEQYADLLIQQLSRQLKLLYDYGARKIVIFGVEPIGCTPNAISVQGRNRSSSCVEEMNTAASIFNDQLRSLLNRLKTQLHDAKFIYATPDLSLSKLVSAGIRYLNAPCCPLSENGLCIRDREPCKHRKLYAFWDGFHPTETVDWIFGTLTYIKIQSSGILLDSPGPQNNTSIIDSIIQG